MTHPTYRAIFFDLDGTLLPMELDEFMKTYFQSLGAYVAKYGVSPEAFMAGMKEGIKAMAAQAGDRSNAEVFWEGYFKHVDRNATAWEEELNLFYENEFGAVGKNVVPNPAAARAVNALVAKGYPLVLTTMPMFPLRAVQHRLSWAGVDPAHFERITSFSNSTSVKPKLSYFAENLAAAGVAGSDVLMVGNNTLEDLAIQALGADAYLVTDLLLDPIEFNVDSVRHGSLEAFADWVETLPDCQHPATDIEAGLIAGPAREYALVSNGGREAQASTGGTGENFSINGIED